MYCRPDRTDISDGISGCYCKLAGIAFDCSRNCIQDERKVWVASYGIHKPLLYVRRVHWALARLGGITSGCSDWQRGRVPQHVCISLVGHQNQFYTTLGSVHLPSEHFLDLALQKGKSCYPDRRRPCAAKPYSLPKPGLELDPVFPAESQL